MNKRPAKKAGLTIEPPPFIPPVIMPALEPPMFVTTCMCVKWGELKYREVPKFWTHWKIFYVFCDVSVREKDWRSRARGAQAT